MPVRCPQALVPSAALPPPPGPPVYTTWLPHSCSSRTLLSNSAARPGRRALDALCDGVHTVCAAGSFPLSFPAAGSGRHVDAAEAVAGGAGGYRPGGEAGVREAGVAAY